MFRPRVSCLATPRFPLTLRDLFGLVLIAAALALPTQVRPAEPPLHFKAAYKDGELLVKYREHAADSAKEISRSRHRAARVRGFSRFRLERVRVRPGLSVEEALSEYRDDPDVEYAEPNYRVQALEAPNDPLFPHLWGLLKINAPQAWEAATGTDNVVVAVIDTGIDYSHPDLIPNLWVNAKELNGSLNQDDDGDGFPDDVHGYNAARNNGDPRDDNGHGTHVAGTIGAAGNNGTGVVGVNWNVKILACKFLDADGAGYLSDAIECLHYVRTLKDRGVNIVATNNSWGGGTYSRALFDTIQAQEDILFIAAAGNASVDNDASPSYPASFDLPNVISVAATTDTDDLAYFSNYGRRSVHVAAPGEGILSTIPQGGYGFMSGTSMATPHVTGLAALLKATHPDLDWRGIRNLILSGGTSAAGLEETTLSGRRLDAAGALTCNDSALFSALRVPAVLQVGVPTTLSALSINCADPVGPVTVTLSDGDVIILRDDGLGPDAAAGDGIFSAQWTPERAVESFTFASPAGSEQIARFSPLVAPAATLPPALAGRAYAQRVSAYGGIPPYAWSIIGGSLPQGLTLDAATGSVSGVPTTSGSYTFRVLVTDQVGNGASALLGITVSPAPLTITSASLPDAYQRTPYTARVQASGGVAPYTWSVYAASQGGFTIGRSTGTITGTPSFLGPCTLTIRVRDARGATDFETFSFTVAPAPLVLRTASLANGTVGRLYGATLSASGGVAPYTWSVSTGSLPAGLTLNASTGKISGRPSTAGTFPFTVRVSDTRGSSTEKAFSLKVGVSAQVAAAKGLSATSQKQVALR